MRQHKNVYHDMERRPGHQKRIGIGILLLHLSIALVGQIGGKNNFEFLSLPASARLTGLGGSLITIVDSDINLAMASPALLNEKMNGSIAFNHNFNFDGINNGHLAYGRKIEKWGINTQAAISYANYGEFIAADETGVQTGTFKANELAFTLGASKVLNEKITVGSNLKMAFSNLESYKASALLMDLGMVYSTQEGRVNIAAVIQNLGTELTTYNGTRYGLPLNIQIGLSNKLKHMPLRFSVIFHQLQQWSIRYDDPNNRDNVDLLGQQIESSALSQAVDNFFRHTIFNGEFLLGKNEGFVLRAGYNHLRRKELQISQFRSLGGFSLGVGLKIKQFRIDYGVGYFHLAGGTNHLSIATNLNNFKSKTALIE
ncbi:MAG: type IX secretion system protein PorQ [Saprospiraceae bacterium]|nr:type IX secretion system protein PorQ [Saprospiraceae bacterium]